MRVVSERLHFCFDEATQNMRADIPRAVWSDMHDKNIELSKNTGNLIRRQDDNGFLLLEQGLLVNRAQFNLEAVGRVRDREYKRNVLRQMMFFMNGLHAAAGPARLDPYFMAEGSIIPAVGKNYRLRSAVIWPVIPAKAASVLVTDKMKQAKNDLVWDDPKNGDVGAVVGPGTEAVLYTDINRHEALIAKLSRPVEAGMQVALKSETLPTLSQSFICLVGALALAQAEKLA